MQSLVKLSELTTTPAVSETSSVFQQLNVNCLKSKTLSHRICFALMDIERKKAEKLFTKSHLHAITNVAFSRSQRWKEEKSF